MITQYLLLFAASAFALLPRYSAKMSSHPTYDICVIGAGVVGSCTARYLASRGQKTLLLEQVIARYIYVIKTS